MTHQNWAHRFSQSNSLIKLAHRLAVVAKTIFIRSLSKGFLKMFKDTGKVDHPIRVVMFEAVPINSDAKKFLCILDSIRD
jgi:hypothetical protein